MSEKELDDLQPIVVTAEKANVQPIRIGNPCSSPQPACEEQTISVSQQELVTFEEFLKSEEFKRAVKEVANETGVSPVTIAERYTVKFLGTISDTGVTAVNTVEQFIDNVLDVVHSTLKGANKTVCNLGKGVVKTVTLNKELDK